MLTMTNTATPSHRRRRSASGGGSAVAAALLLTSASTSPASNGAITAAAASPRPAAFGARPTTHVRAQPPQTAVALAGRRRPPPSSSVSAAPLAGGTECVLANGVDRDRNPPNRCIGDSRLFANAAGEEASSRSDGRRRAEASDYLRLVRPVTLLQAVGALLVGYLALVVPPSHGSVGGGGGVGLSSAAGTVVAGDRFSSSSVAALLRLLCASLSVYLSYGSGMVMNDCVDAELDATHAYESKRSRPLASGSISVREGRTYAASLGAVSLALGYYAGGGGGGGPGYALWTASNLVLMLSYALGLQNAILVKNAVVGYLSVSPLLGAALLVSGGPPAPAGHLALRMGSEGAGRLWRLASVGFPVSVAREVLKDLEDVESDRGRKLTLPHVVGERASRWLAFGLVWLSCGLLCLPSYRSIFSSSSSIGGITVPWYGLGHALGTGICLRANAAEEVREGQKWLKKAIYALLGGMIAGLLT